MLATALTLALFPLSLQVNSERLEQYGGAASFAWSPSENFAVMAVGQWNWWGRASRLSDELVDRTRLEDGLRELQLVDVYAALGTEMSAWGGTLGPIDFDLLVTGALGAAKTRVQLKPLNEAGPATYGDLGWRPGMQVGAGVRIAIGEHLALRIDLTDLMVSSRVAAVNGCDRADLQAIDDANRLRGDLGPPVVSRSCDAGSFNGVDDQGDTDPSNDRKRSDDAPLAFSVAKPNAAVFLHDFRLQLGISYTF